MGFLTYILVIDSFASIKYYIKIIKKRKRGEKKMDPNGHQVIRCWSGQDMELRGDYL